MSEKITRPHRSACCSSSGVVNEKYWTDGALLAVVSSEIHLSATSSSIASSVCCTSLRTISPCVVEAPTLTSHCERSSPLGKLRLTSAVIALPRSLRELQVPTVSHGSGPFWIQ